MGTKNFGRERLRPLGWHFRWAQMSHLEEFPLPNIYWKCFFVCFFYKEWSRGRIFTRETRSHIETRKGENETSMQILIISRIRTVSPMLLMFYIKWSLPLKSMMWSFSFVQHTCPPACCGRLCFGMILNVCKYVLPSDKLSYLLATFICWALGNAVIQWLFYLWCNLIMWFSSLHE